MSCVQGLASPPPPTVACVATVMHHHFGAVNRRAGSLEQGGVPMPHPLPQASIPHEHLSGAAMRPPRDMRPAGTVESAAWEHPGHGRVIPGATGSGEFEYAEGYSSHRGGYEVSGHPAGRLAVSGCGLRLPCSSACRGLLGRVRLVRVFRVAPGSWISLLHCPDSWSEAGHVLPGGSSFVIIMWIRHAAALLYMVTTGQAPA